MNDLIAASRQALEALEDLYAEQNAAPLWKRREHWENSMIKADAAMPALRTAIEAAEKQQALDKKAENARELGLSYDQNQE